MMDKAKFKKILTQHRLWLESHGKKGKSADLRGVDPDVADLFVAVAIVQEQHGKARTSHQSNLDPDFVKQFKEACPEDLKGPK